MASFNQDPLGQLSVEIPSITVPVSGSNVDAASTNTNTAPIMNDGSEYTVKFSIDSSYNQLLPRWRRNKGIVSTESV